MAKFFRFPFAVAGDKTAVPDDLQPGGSVSYNQGYPLDYELDSTSNPAAKNIERDKMNQLFNDVTGAIQQYQTFGFPDFITTADNNGTPYSYTKYAIVRYDDGVNGPRIYQSSVNSNTVLPTDDTKWDWLDFSASDDAIIIDNAIFDTGVTDGKIVYWNTSINKYALAVANGTSTQNVTGVADVTNSRVFFSGLVPILSGLTPGAIYYLSSSSAGAVTSTQPANNIVRVGVAKNTTTLFLNPIFQSGFEVSLTSMGYQYLPSGLLLQWGEGVSSPGGASNLFPIAFPNECFQVVASDTGSGHAPFGCGLFTTTAFICYSSSTFQPRFWAIGY